VARFLWLTVYSDYKDDADVLKAEMVSCHIKTIGGPTYSVTRPRVLSLLQSPPDNTILAQQNNLLYSLITCRSSQKTPFPSRVVTRCFSNVFIHLIADLFCQTTLANVTVCRKNIYFKTAA